jgi:hypothetical protein
MIGLVLPLIGYASAATVIAAVVGYGYLRNSGRLSDATLFHIIALVNGVDVHQIQEASQKAAESAETPPEEPSYSEQQDLFQTASLQFDAKRKQLGDSLTDFEVQLKLLQAANDRYDRLRKDVEMYLNQQLNTVAEDGLQQVRTTLESLVPQKQAKPILVMMLKDGQTDEVIKLLGMINKRTRTAILQSFNTPEDLEMLKRINDKVLAGDPVKPFIDSQLESLKQLNEQGN